MPHARPGKEWLHLRDAICMGNTDAVVDVLAGESIFIDYEDMKIMLMGLKQGGTDACAVVDEQEFKFAINDMIAQATAVDPLTTFTKERWDRVFNDMVGQASGRLPVWPSHYTADEMQNLEAGDYDSALERHNETHHSIQPIGEGRIRIRRGVRQGGITFRRRAGRGDTRSEGERLEDEAERRRRNEEFKRAIIAEPVRPDEGEPPSHYTKDTPQGALESMEERLTQDSQFTRRITQETLNAALNELNIKVSELQGAILDLATQTVSAPVVEQIRQATVAIEEAAVQATGGKGVAAGPKTVRIREYALSLGQGLSDYSTADIILTLQAEFPDITIANVQNALNAGWRTANNLPSLKRTARPTSAPPPTAIPVEPMEGGEIADLLGGLDPVRYTEQPEWY